MCQLPLSHFLSLCLCNKPQNYSLAGKWASSLFESSRHQKACPPSSFWKKTHRVCFCTAINHSFNGFIAELYYKILLHPQMTTWVHKYYFFSSLRACMSFSCDCHLLVIFCNHKGSAHFFTIVIFFLKYLFSFAVCGFEMVEDYIILQFKKNFRLKNNQDYLEN